MRLVLLTGNRAGIVQEMPFTIGRDLIANGRAFLANDLEEGAEVDIRPRVHANANTDAVLAAESARRPKARR